VFPVERGLSEYFCLHRDRARPAKSVLTLRMIHIDAAIINALAF
jgi:hypothetical protein